MPNLKGIMQLINQAMLNDQFKSSVFQQSQFNTQAYVLPTIELDPSKPTVFHKPSEGIATYRPYLKTLSGELTDLTLDDRYTMQVFHILDVSDFSEKQEDDFGSPGRVTSEIDTCRMIFYGDEARLNLTQEDIMSAAMLDFPREFSPTQIAALGLSACVFDQVTVVQDQEAIFESLWKGHEYSLTPSQFIFSINYKIKAEYNKSCYKLCP